MAGDERTEQFRAIFDAEDIFDRFVKNANARSGESQLRPRDDEPTGQIRHPAKGVDVTAPPTDTGEALRASGVPQKRPQGLGDQPTAQVVPPSLPQKRPQGLDAQVTARVVAPAAPERRPLGLTAQPTVRADSPIPEEARRSSPGQPLAPTQSGAETVVAEPGMAEALVAEAQAFEERVTLPVDQRPTNRPPRPAGPMPRVPPRIPVLRHTGAPNWDHEVTFKAESPHDPDAEEGTRPDAPMPLAMARAFGPEGDEDSGELEVDEECLTVPRTSPLSSGTPLTTDSGQQVLLLTKVKKPSVALDELDSVSESPLVPTPVRLPADHPVHSESLLVGDSSYQGMPGFDSAPSESLLVGGPEEISSDSIQLDSDSLQISSDSIRLDSDSLLADSGSASIPLSETGVLPTDEATDAEKPATDYAAPATDAASMGAASMGAGSMGTTSEVAPAARLDVDAPGSASSARREEAWESVVREPSSVTARLEAERVVPDVAAVGHQDDTYVGEGVEDGQMPTRQLDQILTDMAVLLRYGHENQVQEQLEQLRRVYPEDLLLMRRLAEFYVQAERPKLALDPLFALAGALFERRNLEGMRQTLEQVLALDADNPRAFRLLGLLEHKSG